MASCGPRPSYKIKKMAPLTNINITYIIYCNSGGTYCIGGVSGVVLHM